jgi:hypothetical protein
MKTLIRKKSVIGCISIISISLFLSCKKEDKSSSLPNSFLWTYNGTSYRTNLDSAYPTFSQNVAIVAKSQTEPNSLKERLTIVLFSFDVGTHSFGNATPALNYTDQTGASFHAISGSLQITRNQNKLLTGFFSAVLTNNEQIEGNFTNLPTLP